MSDPSINLALSASSTQKPDFFQKIIEGEQNEIKKLKDEQEKDPGSAEKTINRGGNSKVETVKTAKPKKDNSREIAAKEGVISKAEIDYTNALNEVSKMRASDKQEEKKKEKEVS